MRTTLGEAAPLYSMVKKWGTEYKCGTESLKDDSHLRRPFPVITQDTIGKIYDTIIADWRVTEHDIVTDLDISQESAHAIICNEFQISEVSAHWFLKLPWLDQKPILYNRSRGNVAHLRRIYRISQVSCYSSLAPTTKFSASLLSHTFVSSFVQIPHSKSCKGYVVPVSTSRVSCFSVHKCPYLS